MCILIIICIRKGHQVYYEKILNQNKKVLSLFLSLVLVISSVSVCFTAFASDGAMVIKEEYVVTVNKSVLQCEKNSQLQKNVYLFIASVDDRYCVVDKYYDAAKLYYFNKNANGSPFTGVYNGYYYKAGKHGTANAAYYKVYNKKLYLVSKNEKASVYKKDTKKDGTYLKVVDSVYYSVSYKTGSASLFTGKYKNKFYKSGKLTNGWQTYKKKTYYCKSGVPVKGIKKSAKKTIVSKQSVPDCDGSGHGYYVITWSDGSVTYEEY